MDVIIHQDLFFRGEPVFKNSPLNFHLVPAKKEAEILRQHHRGIKVIVLDSKPLSDDFFRQLENGSCLIRFGTNTKNINHSICQEKNILVKRVESEHVISLAEYSMSLILALAKRICSSNEDLKKNLWEKKLGLELWQKKLFILGLGKTGQALARMAKLAFNMEVIGLVSPEVISEVIASTAKQQKTKFPYVDRLTSNWESVIAEAHFVSLHLSNNPKKPFYIDKNFLNQMRPDAFLINVARGNFIDEPALFHQLKNKLIAGAALDVFEKEPYVDLKGREKDYDLRTLPNVILTPHSASNTKEANYKTALAVERMVLDYYDADYYDALS